MTNERETVYLSYHTNAIETLSLSITLTGAIGINVNCKVG